MLKAKRKYALICRRQEHFIESHPIAPSGFRPSGQNLTNDPCVDSLPARHMRVWPMRTGITVEMSATDRARLAAIVGNRNSRQKHVWRARIMLLSVRAPALEPIQSSTLGLRQGECPCAIEDFRARAEETHRVIPTRRDRNAIGHFAIASAELDCDRTVRAFFCGDGIH
jgi:hypothetical protein